MTTNTARRAGVLLVLLFIGVGRLRAGDTPINVTFTFTYLKCTLPVGVHCNAYREEDFDSCRECAAWESETVVRVFQTELADIYVDLSKPANKFIKDILTSVYDLTPEQAEALTPPKIASLFDDPRKYGWVELAEPRAGAILIDRMNAVFIVSNPPMRKTKRGPRTFRRFLSKSLQALAVIYPSALRHNSLTPSSASRVFGRHRTKAIVPAAITEALNASTAQAPPIGWNVWLDRPERRYRPFRSIEPGRPYDIAVALAPFEFRDQYGHLARLDLRDRLASDVKQHRIPGNLTAVLSVDESMLEPLDATRKSTAIEMKRMESWYPDGVPPAGDPLEYLARGGDPAFVFAEQRFSVRALREGPTVATISLWQDGWPVDEISIPICVSRDPQRAHDVCGARSPLTTGFDSSAFPRRGERGPVAAIDLSFDNQLITATFHRNDMEEAPYYSWRLPMPSTEFTAHLAELTDQFGSATDEQGFALAGEKLFRLIFAESDPRSRRAIEARNAFTELVEDYMLGGPVDGGSAPILYIRCLEGEPVRRVHLIPFGLMKIPQIAHSFVGFWFNTESALPRRVTMQEQSCVSRWCFVVPPRSAEFKELRRELDKEVPSWPDRAHVFGLPDFAEWIRKEQEDPATAIVIISHYGTTNGVSRLVIGDDNLASVDISRVFNQPSIAILNACGSAQPGAEDFVNVLNMHGVDTIIATRYEVSTELAIEYFAALDSYLPWGPDGATSLAAANFDAVKCLSERRPSPNAAPFGPAALAYTVLGEPSLSLCQPNVHAAPP